MKNKNFVFILHCFCECLPCSQRLAFLLRKNRKNSVTFDLLCLQRARIFCYAKTGKTRVKSILLARSGLQWACGP